MTFKGTIFVEGKADSKFVGDLVKEWFNYSLKSGVEIQETEGKDSLKKFAHQFQKSTDQGLINLLIFDANGNYQARVKELIVERQALKIQFEVFLFPNNEERGDLETLLRRIARNEAVFGCIDTYKRCLKAFKFKI